MSLGPGVKMVQAVALSVINIDDVHKRWHRYHTRKMLSRMSGSKRCSTARTLIQKDSYQYDLKLMHDDKNIPPTWHKRDFNAIIHGDT